MRNWVENLLDAEQKKAINFIKIRSHRAITYGEHETKMHSFKPHTHDNGKRLYSCNAFHCLLEFYYNNHCESWHLRSLKVNGNFVFFVSLGFKCLNFCLKCWDREHPWSPKNKHFSLLLREGVHLPKTTGIWTSTLMIRGDINNSNMLYKTLKLVQGGWCPSPTHVFCKITQCPVDLPYVFKYSVPLCLFI